MPQQPDTTSDDLFTTTPGSGQRVSNAARKMLTCQNPTGQRYCVSFSRLAGNEGDRTSPIGRGWLRSLCVFPTLADGDIIYAGSTHWRMRFFAVGAGTMDSCTVSYQGCQTWGSRCRVVPGAVLGGGWEERVQEGSGVGEACVDRAEEREVQGSRCRGGVPEACGVRGAGQRQERATAATLPPQAHPATAGHDPPDPHLPQAGASGQGWDRRAEASRQPGSQWEKCGFFSSNFSQGDRRTAAVIPAVHWETPSTSGYPGPQSAQMAMQHQRGWLLSMGTAVLSAKQRRILSARHPGLVRQVPRAALHKSAQHRSAGGVDHGGGVRIERGHSLGAVSERRSEQRKRPTDDVSTCGRAGLQADKPAARPTQIVGWGPGSQSLTPAAARHTYAAGAHDVTHQRRQGGRPEHGRQPGHRAFQAWNRKPGTVVSDFHTCQCSGTARVRSLIRGQTGDTGREVERQRGF